MTVDVVGGVYREYCTRPNWSQTYGSAGRAAMVLGAMHTPVTLHSYMDQAACDELHQEAAWHPTVRINPTLIDKCVDFRYLHDLATPDICGVPQSSHAPINISGQQAIRFGMLEGDAVVHAEWAVYDPQNMGAAVPFGANGSTAEHLALVLNSWEASQLAKATDQSPEECARIIAQSEKAEVVVIKMGPRGALVWFDERATQVTAYRTSNVWKIGSGDFFVAQFANWWMHERLGPTEAAARASHATAYYCENRAFPNPALLAGFTPMELKVSEKFGVKPKPEVYLAGPFFNLAQVWIVEEARKNLREVGLRVFSPFHDIGLGSACDVVQKDLEAVQRADLVFAVADGLDAGTLYEVGYARALGKPVVVYSECESEESLKMMEGSGCVICTNYATAIYSALWEAARL
jgi:nucleoside 2-deoxyribosyltransferase